MKAIACRTDRIQMKKNMSLSLFPWPWAWIVAGQGCYFGCRLGIAGLKQMWSCILSQSESDWLRIQIYNSPGSCGGELVLALGGLGGK